MPAPSHATDAKQNQKDQTRSPATMPQNRELTPTFGAQHSLLSLHRSIGNRAFGHVLQAKLAISSPGDVYEQEADRVAEHVMRMPDPTIQRKCAACGTKGEPCQRCQAEQGQIIQRKVGAPFNSIPSADSVSSISHLAPGRPLAPSTRAFFEPRFGADFGRVRIHTDPKATESAQAVNALAYTLGNNVVFNAGQFQPESRAGQQLLAHELAHVVQQMGTLLPHTSTISTVNLDRASPEAHAVADPITTASPCGIEMIQPSPILQRKMVVDNPKGMIPNPTGKGAIQTNAKTVENYLTILCSGGSVAVDGATGDVKIDKSFCTAPALLPGQFGPPSLSPAQASKTSTGCGCICDMVDSKNLWTIKVDDASWPHTVFDNEDAAKGITPGGSGGTVTTPSPNSLKLWGAGTASGKKLDIDPWLVLGHELCGHGWLGNSGLHGPDEALPRGEGGHQETVKRENELRQEHGIELRGTFKDPNCGESYWRDKKKPGKVNWSSFLDICKKWRAAHNKKNGTKYKITDKIP